MSGSSGGFDPSPIIADILSGNRDAFRLLVREYGLVVRGYLASRLHHLDDVDDVAQDVFIAAYEGLQTCEPAKFQQWLVGIARNQVRLHWRKNGRYASALERFRQEIVANVESELDQSFALMRAESLERLLDCISRLPVRLRRVIRAGMEGLRVDVLADELGLNRNAIYQARFRGFKALRRCMDSGESSIGLTE